MTFVIVQVLGRASAASGVGASYHVPTPSPWGDHPMNALQWAGVAILGFVSLVLVTDLVRWVSSRMDRPQVSA